MCMRGLSIKRIKFPYKTCITCIFLKFVIRSRQSGQFHEFEWVFELIATLPLTKKLLATGLRCQVSPKTVIFLLVLFKEISWGQVKLERLILCSEPITWPASAVPYFLLPWNPCLHGLCPKKSKFPAFSRGFMDRGVVVWRLFTKRYIL